LEHPEQVVLHDYGLSLAPPAGIVATRVIYVWIDRGLSFTPMALDESLHVVPCVPVGSVVKAMVLDTDELGERVHSGSPIIEFIASGRIPSAAGGVLSVVDCHESG
jgi:hypothetical protein